MGPSADNYTSLFYSKDLITFGSSTASVVFTDASAGALQDPALLVAIIMSVVIAGGACRRGGNIRGGAPPGAPARI